MEEFEKHGGNPELRRKMRWRDRMELVALFLVIAIINGILKLAGMLFWIMDTVRSIFRPK